MLSKNSVTVLRIGLACVFLANALIALLTPNEFKDLIADSFLKNIFPMISSSVFITFILINDSLLTLIFLLNLKFIKYALIWASIWIILVILVTWKQLEALEHLGFLAMSAVLYFELKNKS